jgi:hypothetical protein
MFACGECLLDVCWLDRDGQSDNNSMDV